MRVFGIDEKGRGGNAVIHGFLAVHGVSCVGVQKACCERTSEHMCGSRVMAS